MRKASELLLTRPGVDHAVAFAGFDGATFTNAPNAGVVFVTLKPFEERVKARLDSATILNGLRAQMQSLREAFVLVIPPPSVPGTAPVGTASSTQTIDGAELLVRGGLLVDESDDFPALSQVARPPKRVKAIPLRVLPSRATWLAGTSSRTHCPAVGKGPR